VIVRTLFDIVNLATKQVSENVQERNLVFRYHMLQVLWSFYMLFSLKQWYSTLFVHVPPDIISLQLCTPKVVGT
jgi:hypothetical protein